jgi:hypothetical protein
MKHGGCGDPEHEPYEHSWPKKHVDHCERRIAYA